MGEAQVISWEDRINLAEKLGGFSSEDQKLVSSWTTCAVGEATGCDDNKPPCDNTLWYLGMQFNDAVYANRFVTAREVLSLIFTAVKEGIR